jgi:hypothetical protein
MCLVAAKKNVVDKTQRNEALDKPSEGIASLGRSSPLLQCSVVAVVELGLAVDHPHVGGATGNH